jgi:DNA-binding CsgD family transcriptional regulator
MSYQGEFGENTATVGGDLPKAIYGYPIRRGMDRGPASLVRKSDVAHLASSNVASIMTMFGRIGFGYLLLDQRKKVTEWNEPARVALEVEAGVADERRAVCHAFKELTSNVVCKFTPGTLIWVVIPYRGGSPIIVQDETVVDCHGLCIVMLVSRETSPHPNPLRLQQMFGLTSAEAQLATSLACGQTPLEIARHRRLSRTTVRSQLAALFSKTETKRQSELVALLGHVSVLP